MRIEDVVQAIEASSTAAEFTLCTDIHDFEVVAQSLPVVDRLRQMVAADSAVAELLAARAVDLLAEETPLDRRHPFDHAIAIYLLVLSWTNVRCLAPPLREVLESRLPNLWFSLMAALHLRQELPAACEREGSNMAVPSEEGLERWSYVG